MNVVVVCLSGIWSFVGCNNSIAPGCGISLRGAVLAILAAFWLSTPAGAQTWEQTTFPGSIEIPAIVVNPATGTMYAGTNAGVYRSSDHGANWIQINSGLTELWVMSMAVDSSGNVFAGTWLSPGLFISSDSGDTWTAANNGLSSTYVGSFAVTATGDIWVAGRDGIHFSEDNGASWTPKLSGFKFDNIAMNSSGHIFAGCEWDSTGIWRSTNGGNSWEWINDAPVNVTIWWLHIDDNQNIWAGTNGNGILVSYDNGDTWLQTGAEGYRIHAIESSSQGWLLAAAEYAGVYRRNVTGGVWETVNTGLTELRAASISINSSNDAFIGTFDGGIFRTEVCLDADHDWVCDFADNCPATPNLMQDDTDLDGVGDPCDNCLNDFNPTQQDSDFDGKGDACDPPTEEVTYTTISGDDADLYYSVVADVDRDNYPDLVYCEPEPGGVFVAYGRPDGTLDTPVSLSSIGSAVVAIDYLDTDTLIDIALATITGYSIFTNQGGRIFSSVSESAAGELTIVRDDHASDHEPEVVPAIATGYFNGDQISDLALAPNMILIGLGDGSFADPIYLSWQFEAVDVFDFNVDGFDDLAVLSADRIIVYINHGAATPVFSMGSVNIIEMPALQLPPSNCVADFDSDGYGDFAIVTPVADLLDQSVINVVFWESPGGILRILSRPVLGLAHDLAVADTNRDGHLDIVVANGSEGQIETYFGDGGGHFSDPDVAPIASGDELTYVLASIDLDRDGNPDFLSGATGGGDMLLSYNQNPAEPIIDDLNYFPMITTGYSNLGVTVVNPSGSTISQLARTVSGSEYWRVDADGDGSVDHRAVDFNVMPGLYTFVAKITAQNAGPINMGIGIDGSQQFMIFSEYEVIGPKSIVGQDLEFPCMIYGPGQVPDMLPLSGQKIANVQPSFSWAGLAGGTDPRYGLQVNTRHDFGGPMIVDISDLTAEEYKLTTSLVGDRMYYWQVLIDRENDGYYEEHSLPQALYVEGCCAGVVGDANGSGDAQPTIGDVSALIDAKFISGQCVGLIECLAEADINQSATGEPTCDDITIGDISMLIDYLFITGPDNFGPLPDCR